MKKETFLAILKEESMIFTEKELMEMIDEELAKDPDEMDTDLIDLCLNALDGKYDDDEIRQLNSSSRKRIKLSKVLLIAAIIAAILGCTIPVCAKYLDLNVAAGTVNVTNDHFEVDMRSSDSGVDVLSQLEKEKLNPVIPNELLKSEYVYDNYRVYDKENYRKTYTLDFKSKDVKGSITIHHYSEDYSFLVGKNFANEEYEIFKQITKEDKDILVFGDDETSSIYYIIGNTEYIITINSDFSVAYNIAETL